MKKEKDENKMKQKWHAINNLRLVSTNMYMMYMIYQTISQKSPSSIYSSIYNLSYT
jgi:hypothetical protein